MQIPLLSGLRQLQFQVSVTKEFRQELRVYDLEFRRVRV